MKNAVKILILGAVLSAGAVSCALMDEYVRSTLREVSVVTLSEQPYRSSVSARGSIYETDGGWYAAVLADESDARFIREGQPAEVSGTGFDGARSGVVRTVSDTARSELGRTVVDVTIEITDGSGGLKSGYSAESSIYTDETRIIGTLPYEAIMQDDDGEYVYVFEHSRAVRRGVSTGLELSGGAEIISGLSEGSEVIAEPYGIRENEPVRKGAAQ